MTRSNAPRQVSLTPLVIGLVFIGTAVLSVFYATEQLSLGTARWTFPGLLVAAGLVGLILTVLRSHHSCGPAAQQPEDDDYPDSPYPDPYQDLRH